MNTTTLYPVLSTPSTSCAMRVSAVWRRVMVAFVGLLIAGTALAAPELELAYTNQMTQGWNDAGSGGDYDVSFWIPTAPPGYKVLAHLGHTPYGSPGTAVLVKIPGNGVSLSNALAPAR